MAGETIKKDAKKAIVQLLNKVLIVEYDLILNSPRILDKVVSIDEINDEQFNKDMGRLSKDSLRHFSQVVALIRELGGEPNWNFYVAERLTDVEKLLGQQVAKEKTAISLYEKAKQVARQNTIPIKSSFWGALFDRNYDPENAVNVNDMISVLDRHIADENAHVRLVEDSVATLNALRKPH
ncbi:hypothetical protein ACFLWB_02215 [Chloroflexota bacterium]